MNASVTTMSSKPWRRSRSITCSMQGLPTIGHHRLRLVRRQRPEARSLPARHHDGLHRVSRRAFRRYWAGGQDREPEPDPEEDERPRRALVGAGDEEEARVEHPGRELAEEVDLELVAAAAHERVAEDERAVARQDHGERDPRQPAVPPEEDDGGVDHEAVGERVGELAELRTRRASAARASRPPGR